MGVQVPLSAPSFSMKEGPPGVGGPFCLRERDTLRLMRLVPKGWNYAVVIHLGYLAVLVLLVFAAYEVFQFQSANTSIRLSTYESYLRQEESLAALRRSIWTAANAGRDYFLSSEPSRRERFQGQLTGIRRESEAAVASLARLDPVRSDELEISPKVSAYLGGLGAITRPSENSGASPPEQLRELVPLRTRALEALEDFTRLAQQDVRVVLAEVAERRAQSARRILILIGAVFVVALLVAGFTARYAVRREGERRRHMLETARARQELEQLSARLVEVQEEERRTLSRELHDEVGQTLTALRMEISHSLRVVRDPEPRARLDRARRLAEVCVSAVRNISLMLRPSLLDDLGLAAALQWQLDQLGRRSGIETAFHANDSGETLSDPVKTCVFRTAQEALNNCEKYASASRVEVTLAIAEEHLALEVRDNGIGVSLNEQSMPLQGTGLLGIRERVSRLGGTLTIEGAPGQGTRVGIRLPAGTRAVTAQPVAKSG